MSILVENMKVSDIKDYAAKYFNNKKVGKFFLYPEDKK